jgi:hypothetical protein
MGMFDYITCEMPLPETPEPPPGTVFQTKDVPTPQLYMENWKITADGRLLHEECDYEMVKDPAAPLGWWQRRNNKRWVEVPFHGDISFGTISTHQWRYTGGNWDYRARFTEGRCVRIELDEFTPTDAEKVRQIDAELRPPDPRQRESA